MPGATSDGQSKGSVRAERIARTGTIVSAIMASSCCWLPPLLIVFGVSSAGMVATLEAYRPLLMVVTFGFLGTAFYFTYRPKGIKAGQEDCCPPEAAGGRRRFNMMTMNKVMLWAVTAMAIVFLFFPQFVTGLLSPDNGTITPDMNRVALTVEGMTCPG